MNFDLTGLHEATYNEPITGVTCNGTTITTHSKSRALSVTFKSLKEAENVERGLLERIRYYQEKIAEGKDDKETRFSKTYLPVALRCLDMYRRVYLPYLKHLENPEPVKVQKIIPVTSVMANGQFNLF